MEDEVGNNERKEDEVVNRDGKWENEAEDLMGGK